jgi:hypothetical protein
VSTIVVVLIAFAVLAATLIALEWIRAWREVRLAQANRVTNLFGSGPRAVESEPGDAA